MRRAGSVSLFAAISLALHLAWVLGMPARAPQPQPAAHWVEVSFEEAPSPPLQAAIPSGPTDEPAIDVTHPEPQMPPQPRAAQTEPQQPLAKAHEPRPRAELTPSPQAAPTEAAAPSPPPQNAAARDPAPLAAAAPAPVSPAKPLSILPRAAALGFDALAPASTLRCGANRVIEGQSDCAPSDAETGQAAQAALNRNLDAAAHKIAHLKPREHPKLQRRSDGSYAYDGKVFQALVRTDGTVEFRDSAIEGELHVSPVPFRFTADLNDVVERHILGRELYSAEKQWLLNETRELRDQLASEFRRRELQGANRELERTLQSVLGDGKRSLAQKHEAIFLLWQDCGEDGQAREHRDAVDRFVRRYMPKGSAVGFLADELESFNASRRGLQKFEPYAGS